MKIGRYTHLHGIGCNFLLRKYIYNIRAKMDQKRPKNAHIGPKNAPNGLKFHTNMFSNRI